MDVPQFFSKNVAVYRNRFVELFSSASDALDVQSTSFVGELRSPKCSGILSGANPNPPTRLPDPSS